MTEKTMQQIVDTETIIMMKTSLSNITIFDASFTVYYVFCKY